LPVAHGDGKAKELIAVAARCDITLGHHMDFAKHRVDRGA
jgi:hypothetical protein